VEWLGRPAEDARRIRTGERGYSDPHPSKVAGETPSHQGEEAKGRNCGVVGSFHRIEEEGGTELSQERYQRGRGVVPSRNVHEGGTRQHGVSPALGRATSRPSVAASANVTTLQATTGQATTSSMWSHALQSRDHSAATRWRRALIATVITSRSADRA